MRLCPAGHGRMKAFYQAPVGEAVSNQLGEMIGDVEPDFPCS